MSRGPSLLAAFVAGLGGAGAAIALGGAFGAFAGSTTVTESGERGAIVTQVPAPTATVARDLGSGRFDPPAIYRERAAGVVTISATVAGDGVSGSGFVVAADGYVITNAHVVTNSPDAKTGADVKAGKQVFVRFADGNSLPATIVGFDLFDDIAVLRVDPRRQPLTVLVFGSTESLAVGDPLAVIGSPFGKEQEQSLSVGVVSALGRDIQPPAVSFATPGAIQTDAAINHGNSGGPVFDGRGRVVGVAAQIESTGGGGEGVGFAIPAEAAKRSFTEIVKSGKVAYAWLGVATRPVSRELARQFDLSVTAGLLIDDVTAGGPAERAGLTPGRRTATFQDDGTVHPGGDILISFGGREVRGSADLSAAVALATPGTTVPLEIVRAGRHLTVNVVLGQRPANISGSP